jgi:outer membrane protein assembly factor BamB
MANLSACYGGHRHLLDNLDCSTHRSVSRTFERKLSMRKARNTPDLTTLLIATSLFLFFLTVANPTTQSVLAAEPSYWPQFRGPNASGVAAPDADPPFALSLDNGVQWKLQVPSGHGSPCIWQNRLLLAGFDPERSKFQVLCIDRSKGEVMWQRDVTADKIEDVHPVSSPATATAATDGERVYFYFGSVGLVCFDMEGNPLWEHRLPIPNMRFGSGTSPIVIGDVVLLNRDHEGDPFLLAVDRHTGKEVWKQKLPGVSAYGVGSYATPVVWNDEVILNRTGEVAAYKLENGERTWWCSIAGMGESTPVIGNDAVLVNAWNNFGEPELRVTLPGFNDLVKEHDKNGDKKISKEEFPENLAVSRRPEVADDVPGAQFWIKPFFDKLDANKDGQLIGLEWFAVKFLVSSMSSDHGLFAIRSGGKGDVSKSNMMWVEKRGVAEIPSPLFFEGRVYMVKDGGIVSCLDAATGKLIYRERLGGPGAYHSSPILAAGRIYIASCLGVMTVFKAGDTPEVLGKSDLQEPILATPAALENHLYVRTQTTLYAFRK